MIVVAATPLYPPRSRVGAWLATHECLAEMARRGHEVRAYTSMADEVYDIDGVHVEPMGEIIAPLISGADVVVSHHGDSRSRANEYASARNVPHVTMVHEWIKGHKRPSTDLVVFNAVSNVNRRWKPYIVCHPHTRFGDHVTCRGKAVTLINCSDDKGFATFASLVGAMPETQFFGVQGGHGKQHRCQGSNVRVISTTPSPKRHVWPYTRILLMPSKVEAWGMAGVEAMCSGIPVIAHPTPGLRESLGNAGIFTDRDDIDAWKDEILRLDDPMEYATASKRARLRAEELCDGSGPRLFADTIEEMFG